MKKLETLADFEELANVTAVACKRYNVLGKTLTAAKDQMKTFMKANDLTSFQKNGVKLLSLSKTSYNFFDEGHFFQEEPEAYKAWKALRDKYTEVRYKTNIVWHNVETLFPDETYEILKENADLETTKNA